MTDTETFTSNKTGKKYRLKDLGTLSNPRSVQFHDRCGIVERTLDPSKQYLLLEEIIEPVLEVGDWVKYTNGIGNKEGCYEITEDHQLPINLKYKCEIRKANKEHWIKENGEWVKK